MLTLWYFLRRVLKSAFLLALFVGWIPLVFVILEAKAAEEQKGYIALGVGLLIGAAFYVLRVLVWLRPRTAAWLGSWALGDLSFLKQAYAEGLPESTGLEPATEVSFAHPEEMERVVGALAGRGFVEVGKYTIAMERTVAMVLLANAEEAVRVVLFEAEGSKLNAEYVCEYSDGTWLGYCNGPDRGFDPRPGRRTVRDSGADPLALYDRLLAERPRQGLVPLTPATAADSFTRETDQWLRWRRENGFTPSEIGAMNAPLVKGLLTVMCVAIPYVILCGLLAAGTQWVLRHAFRVEPSKETSALITGVVLIALALLPLLLLWPALRRWGKRPRPTAAAAPPAPVVPEPAVEQPGEQPAEQPGLRKGLLGWLAALLPLALLWLVAGVFLFGPAGLKDQPWVANAMWILLVLMWLFPWLRDSFLAARKEATEKAGKPPRAKATG